MPDVPVQQQRLRAQLVAHGAHAGVGAGVAAVHLVQVQQSRDAVPARLTPYR